LSDILDYSKLICDDAGPGYAKSMGWEPISIRDFKNVKDIKIVVVDNRIQQKELALLTLLIKQHINIPFFLKIVDPYYERRDDPYYQFVYKAANFKNTYLLSVYKAVELTKELSALYVERYIYLPYPYLKQKEVSKKHRKTKIIISGALNQYIYPYRYNLWLKVTRSPVRFLFSILQHPGYLEMNKSGSPLHKKIRSAYIEHLSGFRYMLLCPSRCRIEFLKFYECVYAGCIPVGVPPDSYPEEIKSQFKQLGPESFYKDLLKIFFQEHDNDIISQLRNYLYSTRNPEALNNIFKSFIRENPIYTS